MIYCIIGYIIGFLVGRVAFKRHYMNGNFQINESNADKDVYTLFVDDFNKIHKVKYLVFRITRK